MKLITGRMNSMPWSNALVLNEPALKPECELEITCQIGVFLTYASPQGYTFINRELYLPRSWTDDSERCRSAGVPE